MSSLAFLFHRVGVVQVFVFVVVVPGVFDHWLAVLRHVQTHCIRVKGSVGPPPHKFSALQERVVNEHAALFQLHDNYVIQCITKHKGTVREVTQTRLLPITNSSLTYFI